MKKFINDSQTIYLGDCIEVFNKEIPEASIDLIFADPPYNIGKKFNGKSEKKTIDDYLNWSYQWLQLCIDKLKPDGSF